ncbi:scavenger receptor class F member 1-like [Haliotis cracherodii]|uniref:scavenger receptor class F member 1-like n=1 Tax=Haliotis cracherodii TaxID=6455 RepID=UPI0039E97697
MFCLLTLTLLAVRGAAAVTPDSNNTICSYGCQPKYGGLTCQACIGGCYGERCTQHCGHCDRDECHRETGRCYRCRPGHYGKTCDTKCPEHCRHTTTKKHVFCDRHTGKCLETCKEGYYGVSCDKQCLGHCFHSICDKHTGHCNRGCHRGWRGSRCNTPCPTNCLRGDCNSDGTCKHGCNPGFYGLMCNETCSNCYSSGCDRLSGRCDQCSPGFWGDTCNTTCDSGCYTERDGSTNCNRSTGACLGGCKNGRYGADCDRACTTCKEDMCFPSDGSCYKGCKHGWKGTFCKTKLCSVNCLHGACHSDGRCTRGCRPGFHGDMCDKTGCFTPGCYQVNQSGCEPGFYGEICNLTCHTNCKAGEDNLRRCHKDTGSCMDGCRAGWHGDHCGISCSRQKRSLVADKEETHLCSGQVSIRAGDHKTVAVVLLSMVLWMTFLPCQPADGGNVFGHAVVSRHLNRTWKGVVRRWS